ncbi:hypothetical protein M1770_03995 [Spiroplasma citri]|uniref:Hypothetical dna helicase probably c-terminal truncated protein n=1 Tax=Spiroplasma citri TaxID=2133 RepID=Q14MF5_SPICI|nr:hypothetical protein [Spiroplasma citri]WFG99124.1 hypothetical protein M1770_03995 [Spiroplasma citri]CAK99324.1 hypothetical dna helicase probably c-terminal truncated protein [Spiroplasma citri]
MQSLNFRPDNFEKYIGQESIKINLKIMIAASQKQQLPLKHMLFIGCSGMGKTCLMQIKTFDLVFIDEIHAISQEVSEALYPVLEDNCLNLILGKVYIIFFNKNHLV